MKYWFSYGIAVIFAGISLWQGIRLHEISNREQEMPDYVEARQQVDYLTNASRMVVITCDLMGNELKRDEQSVPNRFLGNNRLDVIQNLSRNEGILVSKQEEYILHHQELVSFSPEQVTIKEYVEIKEPEVGYFIGVLNNGVIVYTRDRQEIYEYTNIELWTLPEHIQQQLIDGIYVDSEQELFDFLQTYSS